MDGLSILLLFLPSAVLFGIGYLVRYRKAYWMISGYNTMPAEKKKIETGSDTFYINLETAEQTRELFNSISP